MPKYRIVTKQTVESIYYVDAPDAKTARKLVKEDPDNDSVDNYGQQGASKERIISVEPA